MFCKNCGKELDDRAVICPYCGVPTGVSEDNKIYDYQATRTNGYAIAGFVLSFFIALLGLIFSIIGLRKVDEYNSGKGFSIAGIVISIVSMVLYFIVIMAEACMVAGTM